MTEKPPRRTSLRIIIGALYGLLALLNIIISSVMIVENQIDLILSNINLQQNELGRVVSDELQSVEIAPDSAENLAQLDSQLRSRDVERYQVFDDRGQIWKQYFREGASQQTEVSPEILKKTEELTSENTLFRQRFIPELNEADFSIDLLIPLRTRAAKHAFIFARLSLVEARKRIESLYVQVGVAVILGIVVHLIFAIFVFRLIFRRVSLLTEASNKMAGGDLATRASWRRKRQDELDDLGDAFNSMAANIQQNVATITELNSQIELELTIGKEVQELFLGNLSVVEQYKPALFYRPMRQVSGDVYKFYKLRDGHTGVFFADAAGHGVSAALITTITILSLDEALQHQLNPAQVMTSLNAHLAERLDTSYYATGVFMLIGPGGKTYITNGGHNNVIFLPGRSEDETVEIKSHGPPLGLMDGVRYKANMVNTKSGDRIFVHSDGLIETVNDDGEQYGIERVLDQLRAGRGLDTTTAAHNLQTAFTSFVTKYHDDVSFLLLEIP
ncbi:MAG: SpoIIE family protein phosphatase [Leptospirales bacterium]|nr:SpoIIE family protein phosphatase [Leptospirales bacterium]